MGRHKEDPKKKRDFRANFLLDEPEERTFQRLLDNLSMAEGRPVGGSEVLRAMNIQLIRRLAEEYSVKLNPTDAHEEVTLHRLRRLIKTPA